MVIEVEKEIQTIYLKKYLLATKTIHKNCVKVLLKVKNIWMKCKHVLKVKKKFFKCVRVNLKN